MSNLLNQNTVVTNKGRAFLLGLVILTIAGTGMVVLQRMANAQVPAAAPPDLSVSAVAVPAIAADEPVAIALTTEDAIGFSQSPIDPNTAYTVVTQGPVATENVYGAPLAPQYQFSTAQNAYGIALQRYTSQDPKDAELTKRSIDLAREIQSKGSNDEAKADAKKQLKDVLSEQFAERQSIRKRELAELKDRVTKLEDVIQARESKKEEIVSKRMNQLLNEPDPMEWETYPSGSVNVTYGQHGISRTRVAPRALSVPSAAIASTSPAVPLQTAAPRPTREWRNAALPITKSDIVDNKIRELEAMILQLKSDGDNSAEAAKIAAWLMTKAAELQNSEKDQAYQAYSEMLDAAQARQTVKKSAVEAEQAAKAAKDATEVEKRKPVAR